MSQPPGTPLKSPWTHRLPALFISSPPDEKQKGLVSGLFVSLQPQSVVAFFLFSAVDLMPLMFWNITGSAEYSQTQMMRCEKKRRWRRSSWFTCDDHDEVSAASLRMIIPLSVTSAQEPGLSSNRLRGSCERTDKNCFQQQTQLLQLTRTPTCSRKVTRSKRRFSLRLCALCLQPHDRNTRKTSSCLMSQWRKVRNLLYQPVKHD